MIGVEATMDVIGGKWKPIILCNLRHGAMRPSDLKRGITGISQKMLTQQLRELEEDNIIDRKVNRLPFSADDIHRRFNTDHICTIFQNKFPPKNLDKSRASAKRC
jgi:phage gp45-like